MKMIKPHSVLLALCLGASTPVVLAATDLNDQRSPGTQTQDSGQMNGQGDASGSGTPGDGLGTSDGGTDDNGTDSTGGDGTTNGSGTEGGGNGAGSSSGGAGS